MKLLNKLQRDIKGMKAQLEAEYHKKGLRENFGQEKVRLLNDMYYCWGFGYADRLTANKMMNDFDNWCMTFTGS